MVERGTNRAPGLPGRYRQPGDGDGPPGAYVRTDVSDNGVGIPPDAIERIFDPSYTTKPKGKGTGLGLAISRHFCRLMGGDLTAQSEYGQGSTFTVRLPTRVPAPATATPE